MFRWRWPARGPMLLVGISLVSIGLGGCLPHEPLPYSPNYSRVTMVNGAPPRSQQSVLVPDACITPDVAEQPVYLPPGCANNLNLQFMVEHQRDLLHGREPGPPAAAPATRAAERYLYGGTVPERRASRNRLPPDEQPPPAVPSAPQDLKTNTN